MRQSVVGIDMAANPKDTWAAFGEVVGPTDLWISSVEGDMEDSRLKQLIQDGQHAVVAIDAPFGWPDEFVSFVSKYHRDELAPHVSRDDFRYRFTDTFVRREAGKNPLSASTDRIGIVAHRTAQILAELEGCDVLPFRANGNSTKVIEVYPGATLAAFGLPHTGYKPSRSLRKVDPAEVRATIISELSAVGVSFTKETRVKCQGQTDALDACICALTAREFLNGSTWNPPEDKLALVAREGWIFFPSRGGRRL